MVTIVKAPTPVLSQKAKPIKKFDKHLEELIKDMTQALENARDPEGIGLAAPQIGVSEQVFIIKESKNSPLKIYINPKLSPVGSLESKTKKVINKGKKDDSDIRLEGCLSLGDIWGVVDRYKKVLLSYQDETGTHHEKEFSGFLATIMQHEFDHLQGILFPRRVLEQQGTLYKSKKDAKGELVFDEIPL